MTHTQSNQDIEMKCFCGATIDFVKSVGTMRHYKCSAEQHFSFSVNENRELDSFSARVNDTLVAQWFKQMDFSRLVFGEKRNYNTKIISSLDDLKLFLQNPTEFVQNSVLMS